MDKMFVLFFWAKWYPQSNVIKTELSKIQSRLSHLIIGWCDVDKDKALVDHFEVTIIPFIILMHVSQKSNLLAQ